MKRWRQQNPTATVETPLYIRIFSPFLLKSNGNTFSWEKLHENVFPAFQYNFWRRRCVTGGLFSGVIILILLRVHVETQCLFDRYSYFFMININILKNNYHNQWCYHIDFIKNYHHFFMLFFTLFYTFSHFLWLISIYYRKIFFNNGVPYWFY